MEAVRKIGLAALLAVLVLWNMSLRIRLAEAEAHVCPQSDTVYVVDDEWIDFVLALIEVESKGNPDAVSSAGAAGILQLMPVYVRECNRLLGEERYAYADRFDARKSLEMFQLTHDKKNPEHDIEKAIRMHNPKAGRWYANRIYALMDDKD